MDAFHNGPREKLMYVTCIRNNMAGESKKHPDYLSTIDVDPDSPTYSQVRFDLPITSVASLRMNHPFQIIHRLPMAYIGDEIHHSGYNACSSCYDNPNKSRKYLILPCLSSDRVYVVDLATNPKTPRIHHVSTVLHLILGYNLKTKSLPHWELVSLPRLSNQRRFMLKQVSGCCTPLTVWVLDKS